MVGMALSSDMHAFLHWAGGRWGGGGGNEPAHANRATVLCTFY